MNTWVRRGAGIVVLSAGLIAAGSTAAQASTGPFDTGSGPSLGQWASNLAFQSNTIEASPTQTGIANINVVAGNLQFNNADQQIGQSAGGAVRFYNLTSQLGTFAAPIR